MKRLIMVLGAVILAFPIFSATTETGTIVFKTFVEESPLNTGIRVTHDTEDISTVFDEKFFEASNTITIENTTLDNSSNEITGKFSVLVRRASGLTVDVGITAGLLKNGEDTLEYKLEGNDVNIVVNDAEATGEAYTIPGVSTGIIQHQNIITYTIFEDIEARTGDYTANVVFTITT